MASTERSSGLSMAASTSKLQAEWTELKDAAPITPKRSGHVSIESGDRLLIFGGYAEDDDMERYVVNDLWEWKGCSSGWGLVAAVSGDAGPRLATAVGFVGDTPYMLGGWDPQTKGTGGVILDTVHKLDGDAWTLLEGVTIPGGPASRHVCLSLTDKLLFHNHRSIDHVYLFDGSKFQKQATSGNAPSSRGLHSACMLTETKALFFAGAAQDGNMSNEVFILDTESWKWTAVFIEGDAPSPRASPCLCRFSDVCAVAFGGAGRADSGLVPFNDIWSLRFLDDGTYETATWQRLETKTMPPPRNAATLSLIAAIDNTKEYVLTGGWAPFVETYNDCYVLKLTES